MHDEREMDRVLAIDGVNLIGINNRNLGTRSLTDVVFVANIFHCYIFSFHLVFKKLFLFLLETFEVDISNTKRLLEGERGCIIAQRDILVSII